MADKERPLTWMEALRFFCRPCQNYAVWDEGSSRVVTSNGGSIADGRIRNVESSLTRIDGFATPVSTRKSQGRRRMTDNAHLAVASSSSGSKNAQNAVYNALNGKTVMSIGTNADDSCYSLQRQRSMCCDDSTVIDQSSRDRQGRLATSASYELSEDFIQYQLAVLERKYGIRAKRAAVVIQRAFRRYCLEKQFRYIRRLTRRYAHEYGQHQNRPVPPPIEGRQYHHVPVSHESTRPNSSKPARSVSIDHNDTVKSDVPLPPRRQNFDRIEDLMNQKSRTVYEFSDAEIFGEQQSQRPQLSARHSANRSSLNSANRIRSKSTERYDHARRIHHIPTGAGAKTQIKILSDRAEVLGDTRKTSEPAVIVASIHPYREDPYAPRLNLSKLQVAPPSENTSVSTENLEQRTNGDGAYFTLAAPHTAPEYGTTGPVWKRVSSPKTPRAMDHRPSEPCLAAAQNRRPKAARSLGPSEGSTPSLSTPSSDYGHAQVQSPVDSSIDMIDQPSTSGAPVVQALFRKPSVRNSAKPTETEMKRRYRIGLNFFNKKPDRGIELLINLGFVEPTPDAVARFLLTRKGLSRQMIGEFLGSLQQPFNMAVLRSFAQAVDLSSMEIDVALRKFQSFFRLPGEAQKIERIMQVFADRFSECNPSLRFRSKDTPFVLAFAIIMLNTDLHSPNLKPDRRMKLEDFIKNLKGIDDSGDVDPELLAGIYARVKQAEFRPGHDHVAQVMKVDRNVVGNKPFFLKPRTSLPRFQQLSVPHRRLVCYCRLYEVLDPHKKQSSTAHQREIFLFNDMILITKILTKRKTGVIYSYRKSHSLVGMTAEAFKTNYFENGIRMSHTLENKTILFNARNEDDRVKFLEDLRESILESDEMEALRIELALEKQKFCILPSRMVSANGRSEARLESTGNRDSGIAESSDPSSSAGTSTANTVASPTGSLVNLRPSGSGDSRRRRNSVNSLDSGMSSTASTASRDSSPTVPTAALPGAAAAVSEEPTTPKSGNFSFGALFGRKASGTLTKKGTVTSPTGDTQ